jgi:hypothetical protein
MSSMVVQERRKGKQGSKGGPTLTNKQRQQVKQMITSSQELKVFYATVGSLTVPPAGVLTRLTSVTQGVGFTQRVGNELAIKKFIFKYAIQVGATGIISAADEFNTVRVIIFRWKNDDTFAFPAIGDILDLSAGTITNRTYNFDTRMDYHVLYDQSHVVFNTPIWNGAAVQWNHGVGSNYASPAPIVLPNAVGKILFENNAITGNGHIYSLVVSDSAFSPHPTFEQATEIQFIDG